MLNVLISLAYSDQAKTLFKCFFVTMRVNPQQDAACKFYSTYICILTVAKSVYILQI